MNVGIASDRSQPNGAIEYGIATSELSDTEMQRSPLFRLRDEGYIERIVNQMMEPTMTFRLVSLPRQIIGSTVLNLAVAAPALAAPPFALPFDITSVATSDLLLYGSIALLVIALTAKIIRDRHHVEPTPQGPDLRWWKNPPPNPQS
jgi:hypothetical protein